MRSLLNAIGFLTVIRIHKRSYLGPGQFARCLALFPLVGILLGCLMALFLKGASIILPLVLAAILVVGLETVMTGGIHLDGLADSFDGAFSGERDPEKIVKIMKKGDIGVFGTLSVVFAVLLKTALVYSLFALDVSFLVPAVYLAFMPAFGRWSMVYLLERYESADPKSLSGLFGPARGKGMLAVSTSYTFALSFLSLSAAEFFLAKEAAAPGLGGFLWGLLIAGKNGLLLFLVYGAVFLAGRFFIKRIGQIRGDVVGAVSETAELAILFFGFLSIHLMFLVS